MKKIRGTRKRTAPTRSIENILSSEYALIILFVLLQSMKLGQKGVGHPTALRLTKFLDLGST